jgi:predicted dinucleotide-binding enzyme
VVSAFSTAPSEVLFAVFAARRKKTRPDLVLCGDSKSARKKAARLVRDVGFNPVDLGALSIARYVEPFSLLAAEIAYEGKGGPGLAYRFEHFRQRAG